MAKIIKNTVKYVGCERSIKVARNNKVLCRNASSGRISVKEASKKVGKIAGRAIKRLSDT